ncbi:MAG: c-type cytochrome biogenesis protein CcmI [Saccharospirillum sp.]|nr:c-type cytochrome biogenesis protein CcmI [Saccharospirillum sp.]
MSIWFFIVMLLVAVAFLVLAVWAGHSHEARDSIAEAIDIHKSRLASLSKAHQDGELNDFEYQQFKTETERALLEDTARETRQVSQGRLPWVVVAGSALIISASSYYLYGQWGHAEGVQVRADFESLSEVIQNGTEAEIERHVERTLSGYQAMLENNRDDLEGWFRLASMQMELGQYDVAQSSYEHVLTLLRSGSRNAEDESAILAYLGQTLWAQGEDDAALTRFEQALQFHAQNTMALGFAGRLTYEGGDYEASVRYWTRLKQLANPEADTRLIDEFIQRAQVELEAQGIDFDVDSLAIIRAQVRLPIAWEGLPEEAVLFVYARAPGERMPIVVKRLPVLERDVLVPLTDADAMGPTGQLSDYSEVEVLARVSFSGDAEQSAGDWVSPVIAVDMTEETDHSIELMVSQP